MDLPRSIFRKRVVRAGANPTPAEKARQQSDRSLGLALGQPSIVAEIGAAELFDTGFRKEDALA